MTRLVCCALLFAFGTVQAEPGAGGPEFVKGKHYSAIEPAQPTTSGGAIEVIEAFSYACPHCYDFEPVITEWSKKQPADVSFRRLPVVFKDSWAALAKAYYSAEVLGVTGKISAPLFKALHAEKRKLFDEATLADFFAEQGVKKEEFSKTYNSFSVDSKLRQATQAITQYGVSGVPTIIVNGKYQTSASQAGDYPTMLKVVDFLIAGERGGKPKP